MGAEKAHASGHGEPASSRKADRWFTFFTASTRVPPPHADHPPFRRTRRAKTEFLVRCGFPLSRPARQRPEDNGRFPAGHAARRGSARLASQPSSTSPERPTPNPPETHPSVLLTGAYGERSRRRLCSGRFSAVTIHHLWVRVKFGEHPRHPRTAIAGYRRILYTTRRCPHLPHPMLRQRQDRGAVCARISVPGVGETHISLSALGATS